MLRARTSERQGRVIDRDSSGTAGGTTDNGGCACTTDTRTGADAPTRPRADLAQRRAALARFASKWRHRLPADVRALPERLRDWLAAPPKV